MWVWGRRRKRREVTKAGTSPGVPATNQPPRSDAPGTDRRPIAVLNGSSARSPEDVAQAPRTSPVGNRRSPGQVSGDMSPQRPVSRRGLSARWPAAERARSWPKPGLVPPLRTCGGRRHVVLVGRFGPGERSPLRQAPRPPRGRRRDILPRRRRAADPRKPIVSDRASRHTGSRETWSWGAWVPPLLRVGGGASPTRW
jgi:hypothetical protein